MKPAESVSVGPPDPVEAFWLKQAGEISVKSSIERLDSHGKFLFSVASAVGTLVTGFGIYQGGASLALASPALILPVALIGTSLAFAMLGLTPRLGDVDPTEVESVQRYFEKMFRRRGAFLTTGSILFALGLASTPLVLAFRTVPAPGNPNLSAVLTQVEGRAKLTVKLEADTLPRGAALHLDVLGTPPGGSASPAILATYDGVVAGKPSLAFDVDRVDGWTGLSVEAIVRGREGAELQRSRLVLARPGAKETVR